MALKNADNASQDTLSFSIFAMPPPPEGVSSIFYSSDQSSPGHSAHSVEGVGIVAKIGAASSEGSLVNLAAVTQTVPMSPDEMSPFPNRALFTNSAGHSDHLVEDGAKVQETCGISAEGPLVNSVSVTQTAPLTSDAMSPSPGRRMPTFPTLDQSPPGHSDHPAQDVAETGTVSGKDSLLKPAAVTQPAPMFPDAMSIISNPASDHLGEGGGIVAQKGTGTRLRSNWSIRAFFGGLLYASYASDHNALQNNRKVKKAFLRTDTYNVVIFGETGVGKSSLVNLIANVQDMAPTSSGATGCTVNTRVYDCDVKIDDQTLKVQLFDTVGLDGGSKDMVSNKRAPNVLKRHRKTLPKKWAIDLLMYCVRSTEDIGALQRIYKLLYSEVKGRVPIVLVVTGLEDRKPNMEEWWTINEKSISDLGMKFAGHACITALNINEGDTDELRQRRKQSYLAVCNLIWQQCSQNGMGVPSSEITTTPASKPKNIVLFGEAGAGKSSLVNLMAGSEIAVTSLSMQRCTLHWQEYAIKFDGESYKVFDTIGLEESGLEMNEYLAAVANAYTFIKRLDAEGGVDLLLFCIRAGRFTAALQSNYRFFHDFLCQKKVPIVLAITNLEREQRMEDWWDREHAIFPKYQIHVAGHACITAANGLDGRHQQLYEESRIAIRKLVKDNIAGEHHQAWTGGNNLFVSSAHALKKLLVKNSHIRRRNLTSQLKNRCGMSPETAGQLADMIEQGEVKVAKA